MCAPRREGLRPRQIPAELSYEQLFSGCGTAAGASDDCDQGAVCRTRVADGHDLFAEATRPRTAVVTRTAGCHTRRVARRRTARVHPPGMGEIKQEVS